MFRSASSKQQKQQKQQQQQKQTDLSKPDKSKWVTSKIKVDRVTPRQQEHLKAWLCLCFGFDGYELTVLSKGYKIRAVSAVDEAEILLLTSFGE